MPKKILLAEDSLTMQEVVQMTLAAEDVTVTAVDSVDEALARAKEIDPDLVVADLSMSGKNAYDLARALRAAGKTTPVLALHGSAAPYDAAKGTAAGVTDAIVKPYDSQAMIDKVHELMTASPAKEARAPIQSLAPPIGADISIDAGAIDEAKPATVPAKPPTAMPAAKPLATKPLAPKPLAPKPLATKPTPPEAKPPAAMPKVPAPAAVAKVPVAKVPVTKVSVTTTPGAPEPVAAPHEITIEAEPPPLSAIHEPLPPFEMQAPAEEPSPTREVDVEVQIEASQPPRPGATLLGVPAPEASQPPSSGLPAPASPGPVAVAGVDGAEVGLLRAEVKRLTQRVTELEAALEQVGAGGGGAVDPALQKDVLQRVIWEVVPDLAEALIREELDRLVDSRAK